MVSIIDCARMADAVYGDDKGDDAEATCLDADPSGDWLAVGSASGVVTVFESEGPGNDLATGVVFAGLAAFAGFEVLDSLSDLALFFPEYEEPILCKLLGAGEAAFLGADTVVFPPR